MTTQAPGTNRPSKVVVLAATVALMLSLLPFASVSAAVPSVLSVSRTSATPTTAATLTWTVTFSESVSGVDTTDFTLTATGTASGTVSTVSSGPSAGYTVTLTSVVGDGTLCLNVIDDNTIISVSTSDPTATGFTCTQTYTVDNINPSAVSINRLGTTPTAATSVSWAVTFTESVTGVNSGDFALVAVGGVSGASITGVSGTGSSFTVTANTGSGSGTLGLNLVDDDSIVDAVAQPLGGAGAVNGDFTGQVYTINKAGPTVTINQATGQPDPDNTSPINFTVVFSEGVTGFTGADVVLSGTASSGTTAAVTLGPTTYNVAVTGMTTPGTVIATIPADVAVDSTDGDPNAPSTSTDNQVAWDSTLPTVTVNLAGGQADPTGTSPIVFSVVFNENVTGFTSGDISLASSTAGGTLVASVGGSGFGYTVSVSGMTTPGNVVIVVATGAATDAAGNTSAAPTNTDNSVAWSLLGPTVTINQASGQADPTSTSPINFTVVFNAAVTGFTGGDVVISGTATGTKIVSLSGAGPTYTAAVSGMTSSGTVVATIPADVALGTAPGTPPTRASTSSDNSVTFRLASKYIVTSSNSTPNPGTAVTITAQVADAANVAVPTSGIVVTWSKTGTGGTFATATSTTNASGVATVVFTVGPTTGTIHTVTATSPGGITGTSANITVALPSASLTLTSDLSVTTWRQFVNLSAQFSGSSGNNRLVTFQRMTPALPATWVTIGTATTNGAGRAAFSYGPPYNTQFRAVFAGATDLAAVTSNTATVNVRYKVTLRPGAGTTTFVRPGTRITYTATVRPIAPAGLQRVTFLIYKRVGGVWTLRTSATVPTSAGVASFSWRWSSGQWYMRARGNATIYNLAALSALSKVTAR